MDEVEFYIRGDVAKPKVAEAAWMSFRAVDGAGLGISCVWIGYFPEDCTSWDAVWCGVQRSYAALCSEREYGCHPISHRRAEPQTQGDRSLLFGWVDQS